MLPDNLYSTPRGRGQYRFRKLRTHNSSDCESLLKTVNQNNNLTTRIEVRFSPTHRTIRVFVVCLEQRMKYYGSLALSLVEFCKVFDGNPVECHRAGYERMSR